jgi:hypothetical protein
VHQYLAFGPTPGAVDTPQPLVDLQEATTS